MQNFLKPIFLAYICFGCCCCCCYAFNLFLKKRHIVYIFISCPPFELLIIQIFICLSSQCWLLVFFSFILLCCYSISIRLINQIHRCTFDRHRFAHFKYRQIQNNCLKSTIDIILCALVIHHIGNLLSWFFFFRFSVFLVWFLQWKKSLTSNHFKYTTMLQTFGWSTFLFFSFYSQHLYAINKISPNKLKDANRFVCPHMIGFL